MHTMKTRLVSVRNAAPASNEVFFELRHHGRKWVVNGSEVLLLGSITHVGTSTRIRSRAPIFPGW